VKFLLSGLVIVISALFGVVYSDSFAYADAGCDAIRVVFARGSGEDINYPTQQRFKQQLEARLSTSALSWSFYELGSSAHGGHQYKAISVDPFENPDNLTGAILSGGMANDYGKSVEEGVDELKVYLNDLHTHCPATKIVLGGYSQGAQVIGQSLEQLALEIRSKVTFAALFGDPKLFLPEGFGVIPPACIDSRIASPWRRSIDNCKIHWGALGPRSPYIPQDMIQKVGLWCVDGDQVCGGLSNISIPSKHDRYRIENGPIDEATYEIAVRLDKAGFVANILPVLDDPYTVPPSVMFMIDGHTINERTHFLAVEQPLLESIAGKVMDMHGGTGGAGIWAYGPQCPGFKSIADLDMSYFIVSQDLIPDCPLWMTKLPGQTLKQAMQESLTWSFRHAHPDSQKIFVILSDKPYSELATLASYRASSEMKNDFYIYPLVPENVRSSYEDLKIDGGQVMFLDSSSAELFERQLQQHTRYPYVEPRFDSLDYKALPGQTITFSAEKSIVVDDEITHYMWGFYGSGSDSTTTEPVASHTYDAPYEGSVRLTVKTKSGKFYSTTTQVTVQEESTFAPILDAPKNLRVQAVAPSSARLTWAQNEQADRWLITLDGIPLGYTDKSAILVTDVEYQRDNIFAVYGVTASGEIGEKAEVVLSAEVARVGDSRGAHGAANSGNGSTYVSMDRMGKPLTLWNQAQLDILGSMNFSDTRTHNNEVSSREHSSMAVDMWIALGTIVLLGGGVITWAVKRQKKE